VVAADDVLDEPAEPAEPDDPEDPDEPLDEPPVVVFEVVPESVVVTGLGCWPEESVAEAEDDPDAEPVLPEVLLVAVTVRVSAATMADELREVL
jgi:hypothetical protein